MSKSTPSNFKNKQPLKIKLKILPLKDLKEHEEVDKKRLENLKNQIKKDGILKLSIAVDKNTNVIIDGHFRCKSLKQLGYSKIPAILVDYKSPLFSVESWRKNVKVTKEDVIKAGLTGKKLPPKTSKNMVIISNRKHHISKVEKEVNIPLEELK